MNYWYELSCGSTAWWPREILCLLSSLIQAAILVVHGPPPHHSEILLCPLNDFRDRHPFLRLDQLSQFFHALCFIYFLHCLPRSRNWQKRAPPNFRRQLHRQTNTVFS